MSLEVVTLKGEAEGAPLMDEAHTRSSGALAGSGPRSGTPTSSRAPLPSRLRRAARHCWQHEPLLLATLAGVATGVVLGTGLSFAHLPPLALELIGLPGQLLMRTLKMLVLPLITASVMSGVCSLRASTADMGKVARYTLLYYLSTTMGAVVLGIVVVNIVRPGRGSPFEQLDTGGSGAANCHAANQAKISTHTSPSSAAAGSPVEAFLEVLRSAFPDNVFVAAYNMNVLGVITASLLMGAALSAMGPQAAPMVSLVQVFNDAIGKIVGWVIAVSPIGIASLITTAMCRACNLGATLAALGLFVTAVLVGLLLWGFVVLPAVYYATTRRSPAEVYRGFSQAMATAFGTDSSNATLPITMRCATDNLRCDPRIVQFFLPLGTTVNMNGTALYEAVTVIFIAQAHGETLGFAGTVIVALTATLAAVGAAGIPEAGLVTMIMVLQAVQLERYAGDIAILLAIDWFLDRCRTVVNVLGDAFGTVIIDHHARNWAASVKAPGEPGAAAAVPGPSDGPHCALRHAPNGGGMLLGKQGHDAPWNAAAGGKPTDYLPLAVYSGGQYSDGEDDGYRADGTGASGGPRPHHCGEHHPHAHRQHQHHNQHHHESRVGEEGPSDVRQGLLGATVRGDSLAPGELPEAVGLGHGLYGNGGLDRSAAGSGQGAGEAGRVGGVGTGLGLGLGGSLRGSGVGLAAGSGAGTGGSELHHRHPHEVGPL